MLRALGSTEVEVEISKPGFCFDGSDWLLIKCTGEDGNLDTQTKLKRQIIEHAHLHTDDIIIDVFFFS